MFSDTKNGAHVSAVLYSLCETAKSNGLMPFDYLKYLLEQLARKPNGFRLSAAVECGVNMNLI